MYCYYYILSSSYFILLLSGTLNKINKYDTRNSKRKIKNTQIKEEKDQTIPLERPITVLW